MISMISLNGRHLLFQCFFNPKNYNADSWWNTIVSGQRIEVNCISVLWNCKWPTHVHRSIHITWRLFLKNNYEPIQKHFAWLSIGIWPITNLLEGCDSTIPTSLLNICEIFNLCKVMIWVCCMEWGFLSI
jgi:hypothetical protein